MNKRDAKVVISGLCLGTLLLIVALAALFPDKSLDNDTAYNIAIDWLVDNGLITKDKIVSHWVYSPRQDPQYGTVWDVVIYAPDADYITINDDTGRVLKVTKFEDGEEKVIYNVTS